jgi:hypothetical protein
VAPCSAGAAAQCRQAGGLVDPRSPDTGANPGFPGRAFKTGLPGWGKSPRRCSSVCRQSSDSSGARSGYPRCNLLRRHDDNGPLASIDEYYPHRFRERRRSSRKWLCRELCSRAPGVRLIAREIRSSGVLGLECAFRSRLSSFDHGRNGARFLPFPLLAFLSH